MSVALFVTVESAGYAVSDAHADRIAALLEGLPDLREALLYRPVADAPDHPFASDGSGPALALELRFDAQAAAEAALRADGLGRIAGHLPAGVRIVHQLFAARDFPVPDPAFRPPAGQEPCTFLVHYPGPAADPAAWLDHYDANHPPIMVRFPGVRRVATYRPLPWRSGLPWERGTAMQRNKVAFDSPAALAAALASPVMTEMRADRGTFPPFEGAAKHFPMWTRTVQ